MCSRPAVSASTRSLPRAWARCTASNTMALGSPPSAPRTMSTPARSAHRPSWSAAAARKVSPAARRTERPAADCWRASLPMVVVLPTPLTPTINQTSVEPGRPSKCSARESGTSSSVLIPWPRAREEIVPTGDLLGLDPPPELGQQGVGGLDAHVGPDQGLLERVPGGGVDPPRAQGGDGPAEQAPDTAQATAVGRGGGLGCGLGFGWRRLEPRAPSSGSASGSASGSGRRKGWRRGCPRPGPGASREVDPNPAGIG